MQWAIQLNSVKDKVTCKERQSLTDSVRILYFVLKNGETGKYWENEFKVRLMVLKLVLPLLRGNVWFEL